MSDQIQDFCQCGRPASKVHCPHCGCATVYGLASRHDTVTRPNGDQMTLRCYRCRRCTAVFNDDDWQLRCSALPVRLGRPASEVIKTNPDVPDFSTVDQTEAMRQLEMAMRMRRERGQD